MPNISTPGLPTASRAGNIQVENLREELHCEFTQHSPGIVMELSAYNNFPTGQTIYPTILAAFDRFRAQQKEARNRARETRRAVEEKPQRTGRSEKRAAAAKRKAETAGEQEKLAAFNKSTEARDKYPKKKKDKDFKGKGKGNSSESDSGGTREKTKFTPKSKEESAELRKKYCVLQLRNGVLDRSATEAVNDIIPMPSISLIRMRMTVGLRRARRIKNPIG